ncbi:MAG TPA: MliC family protein [Paracoccaceae bacterium]|nr:MliC family protein [Paracoccaceae bacterium]
MERIVIAAAALAAATLSAPAAEITISVPEATEIERIQAVYSCGDRRIPVEYINAGPVSLAVLTMDDTTIVASNVVAASGARYAGAQYVWWTKGDQASLFDLMQGEDAAPVICTADP